MNEVFTNTFDFTLTVDDTGITLKDVKRITFFPYGSIESKLKVGMFGLTISGHGIQNSFAPAKADKERFKNAIAFAEKANKQAPTCVPKEYPVEDKEHKIKCNVCGHVFCYTDSDVRENERLALMATMNRQQAVMSALAGTTVQSSLDSAEADRNSQKIKDFSRCPKCNSQNLVELSDDYVMTSDANSSADELLKFKGLLDAGIITQEEFDAKKKQLLGL